MPSVLKRSVLVRAAAYPASLDIGRTFDAWHRLAEMGEVWGANLRAHVRRAWWRSRRSGCCPRSLRMQRLATPEAVRLRDREHALSEAARPYVVALSRAVGALPHAVVLCDRHGRTIDALSPEPSEPGEPSDAHAPEHTPGPGALLAEAAAGANGIGTCLVEGRYAELVGPEHLLAAFHPFSSQGIPIRVDGRVVGALGLWAQGLDQPGALRGMMAGAARGIEVALVGRRLADMVQRLTPATEEHGYLEALRQDVVQLQAAARLRLEMAAEICGMGGDADALLAGSERLIRCFHERASLWRDLVGEEEGAPRTVWLHDHLSRFLALLGTEAQTRGITVERGPMASVLARVNPRALSRALLRLFLHAFDVAAEGGRVHVTLLQDEHGLSGIIQVKASGGGARGAHGPGPADALAVDDAAAGDAPAAGDASPAGDWPGTLPANRDGSLGGRAA